MTDRYLVIQPEPTVNATQICDDLVSALEKDHSVTRADTLLDTSITEVAQDSASAFAHVINAVRADSSDVTLLEHADFSAVPTFDSIGWSLDVAASVGARLILVLDAEGVPADLVSVQAQAACARARAHHAQVVALIVPGVRAESVSCEQIPVISDRLDQNTVEQITSAKLAGVVTPVSFQADLIDRARADRQRIVLPEPDDDRVLQAAAEVLELGIADIILLGDEAAIRERAQQLNLDIAAARVVALDDAELVEKYAEEFARLRAKKGVTIEQAREKIRDVSYFGTMMVHMGDADGMVSGAAHTTAHTIVPSFQIIKTAPGVSIVSSVFLMLMKDRVWVFGDCAVNPNPTPEQIADIAISSAKTAEQFGVEPRVAMLSYSTGTSGSGPDIDATVEATRLAREKAPELAIEGPIQFDAAVDPAVAAKKAPDSDVAGKANVFIFPSLNAGNIGYKAVQRSSGAVAVGPVLQGLNKPVNDLSRGALVEDIVNTIALTAVQAQG